MSNIQDDSRFQAWRAELAQSVQEMRTMSLGIKDNLISKINQLQKEIDFIDQSEVEIDAIMAEVNKVMDMREWIKIKLDCAIKLMRLGQRAEELVLDDLENRRKHECVEKKCTKKKKRTDRHA